MMNQGRALAAASTMDEPGRHERWPKLPHLADVRDISSGQLAERERGESEAEEGGTAQPLQRTAAAGAPRSPSGRGAGAADGRQKKPARMAPWKGEKLEGCRRKGGLAPPSKKEGVKMGVVRGAIVGGARSAVVLYCYL